MIFDARLAIATGAVFLTAGFCAWQLSASAEKAQNAEKVKSLSQQVAVVRSQVETQLEKTANDLTAIIQNQIVAPEDTPEFRNSPFLALAVLASPSANQPWQIEWMRSKNSSFTKTFLDTQVTYWALDRLKGDNMSILRLETADRRVYFVLTLQIRFKSATGEDVKVAAAVLPSAFFAGVTDSVKGTADELMLVDAAGFSYAYPDQQYVGSKLDPHPLVKTLIKAPNVVEFKPTATLAGVRAMGGYERLKNANLYVLMSSPVPPRSKAAIEAFLQVGIVTLAIAMLSALCIALFNVRQERKLHQLDTRLKVLDQRQTQPAEVKSHWNEKDRLEAMRDLAFSVVQYLRTPISVMLGHAQIGQTKNDVAGAKEAFTQIESAARTSRDFLEGLAKMNGFEKLELRPFSVEHVIQQSLNSVRGKFEKAGVRIEENYKTAALADLAHIEFRTALQNLLNFMGERLAIHSGTKKIDIDVEQMGSLIKLRFSDSGAALAPEQLRRFFEPFAMGGMHMATLRSLVESFKGTARADRSDSGGLKVEIDLPQHLAETAVAQPESPKTVVKPIVESAAPPPPPTLKLEEPAALLGKPLDKDAGPAVTPPAPVANDVTVKSDISAAEELSVTIRKPKVQVEN